MGRKSQVIGKRMYLKMALALKTELKKILLWFTARCARVKLDQHHVVIKENVRDKLYLLFIEDLNKILIFVKFE